MEVSSSVEVMNIILALAEEVSIREALKAALPATDLLLFESSIDEALRRLVSVHADVVIIDDAPALGLEAVQAIGGAMPNMPVLALSGKGSPDAMGTYVMNGARQCLAKPFQCEDLEQAIDKCLGRVEPGPEPPAPAVEPLILGEAIHQHQLALRWMGRNMVYLEDTGRLAQSLVDVLIDVFDTARAGVLLQTNGTARITASDGIPLAVCQSLRLGFTTGLLRQLEQNQSIIDRETGCDGPDVLKEVQALGARLVAPLVTGGQVCGAVFMGERASGGAYTREERDLFVVMARCTSSCLDKARRHRDLTRQQSRLDAVLANITAGVVTVRPDKTISMMNNSAERILQLSASDVLGRSVQKLGSAFADVVLRSLSDGAPLLRQTIQDKAINATLGLSVTPLGPEGAVAIFSALPEEGDETGVAYSPVWEYLSSRVAQEIKNPMVAINTFSQLLPKKYDSEDFREEFAHIVQKEVARINGVVEMLYEFANHPRLACKKSDLRESVENVLDALSKELEARSIKLETTYDDDSLEVSVDPTLFYRAIENVVQNSIDAMPEGGTLKIATRRENGSHELLIGDTGEGITEKDAPFIFQPFFSTKAQGMGLGLTMALRIMEQHEGKLELRDKTDSGGTFSFHLPPADPAGPEE